MPFLSTNLRFTVRSVTTSQGHPWFDAPLDRRTECEPEWTVLFLTLAWFDFHDIYKNLRAYLPAANIARRCTKARQRPKLQCKMGTITA